MPIIANNKKVVAARIGAIPIAYIYKGAVLVWQVTRSCFGRGFWDNSKPWVNAEPWNNGKIWQVTRSCFERGFWDNSKPWTNVEPWKNE